MSSLVAMPVSSVMHASLMKGCVGPGGFRGQRPALLLKGRHEAGHNCASTHHEQTVRDEACDESVLVRQYSGPGHEGKSTSRTGSVGGQGHRLAHALGKATRDVEHVRVGLERRDQLDELHDRDGVDCVCGGVDHEGVEGQRVRLRQQHEVSHSISMSCESKSAEGDRALTKVEPDDLSRAALARLLVHGRGSERRERDTRRVACEDGMRREVRREGAKDGLLDGEGLGDGLCGRARDGQVSARASFTPARVQTHLDDEVDLAERAILDRLARRADPAPDAARLVVVELALLDLFAEEVVDKVEALGELALRAVRQDDLDSGSLRGRGRLA